MQKNHECFVGVHLGAGYHSASKSKSYKQLCNFACIKTIEKLKSGKSAVEAVTTAIKQLENSSLTNAGFGSNLNEDKVVECDASIMDGKSLLFGAVGAVGGIKNPISLAYKVLCEQNKAPHPLGIIPPCILVGKYAEKWASRYGVEICASENEMVTDESLLHYNQNRTKLTEFEHHERAIKIRKLEDVCNVPSINARLDTVGAVVLDQHGNVAAAVSSGGLILKQSGRVGQAASYGCGCWAQNETPDEFPSIATATTGCGEYLIKTMFAKECAQHMLSSTEPAVLSVEEAIRIKFLKSPFLKNAAEKLVGIIALPYDPITKRGDFLWAHTTETMCVGYMSSNDQFPTSKISRLPKTGQRGVTILVEGITISRDSTGDQQVQEFAE